MWATANSGAGATFHFTIPGGAEAHTRKPLLLLPCSSLMMTRECGRRFRISSSQLVFVPNRLQQARSFSKSHGDFRGSFLLGTAPQSL